MSREELKQKLINLIDMSSDSGPKIAFYSDPKVSDLINELYKRWERSGCRGIPLDYADDEELEFLYRKALKYSSVTEAEAWQIYIKSEESRRRESVEEKKPFWRKLLEALKNR